VTDAAPPENRPKVGLTLPSFREDPEGVFAVARAAETAGLDGVFAYDHLFRFAADGTRRPALELTAMLGALAAETSTIAIGSLVARASLRPAATLAAALDTAARIAPGRVIVAIGSGDHESRAENESFGLEFGTMAHRVARLAEAIDALRNRAYPVWVGGPSTAVRELAAGRADGWNGWGGTVAEFAAGAAELAAIAPRPLTLSWGGLAVLADDDEAARTKAERLGVGGRDLAVGGPDRVVDHLAGYVGAGAEWIIVGPVDSADPDNARRLGADIAPRLRQLSVGGRSVGT
jgi:alkanesulfonate monooxygenase SsuD/methylene tetrahydromethanopterin reductase-like flavin-dependent oxidoreductase (luciferase family)